MLFSFTFSITYQKIIKIDEGKEFFRKTQSGVVELETGFVGKCLYFQIAKIVKFQKFDKVVKTYILKKIKTIIGKVTNEKSTKYTSFNLKGIHIL